LGCGRGGVGVVVSDAEKTGTSDWLSPMRRKQERAISEDPASEIYEGEFYEVDTDEYEDEGE